MRTFLMVGKSSVEELKEIALKYTAEVASLIEDFGGEIKSMYVMIREGSLFLISDFPGVKRAVHASVALTKMTGISFRILPATTLEEFGRIGA